MLHALSHHGIDCMHGEFPCTDSTAVLLTQHHVSLVYTCLIACPRAVPVVFKQVVAKFTPPSTYTYNLTITNTFLRPITALTLKATDLTATTVTGLTAVAGKPGYYKLSSNNLPLKARKSTTGISYTQTGPAATFTASSWKFIILQFNK